MDNFKESDKWQWPENIKGIRDEIRKYHGRDRSPPILRWQKKILNFSQLDFSVDNDQQLESYIDELTKNNETGGTVAPKVLAPSQYRFITQGGKPYQIGGGLKAKVYLIQDMKTDELFAIKIFQDRVGTADVLRECSFMQKGDMILNDNGPAAFHGYFRISDDFASENKIQPYIPVISLISITPNLPVCLTLQQALEMQQRNTPVLSRQQWQDVCVALVKKAQKLFQGNVIHNDYHGGNILLSFYDNRVKISVIDFDRARDKAARGSLEEYVDAHFDSYQALKTVAKIAAQLEMKNTEEYAACYGKTFLAIQKEINFFNQFRITLSLNENEVREKVESLSDQISFDRVTHDLNQALDMDG